MCTIGFDRKLGLLFKNRDKNEITKEEIVKTGNVLAVKTQGHNYFSLGMNKNGTGFVSAAVNSPEWTRLAESGQKEAAAELSKKENAGLISPTWLVSESLESTLSIEDWIMTLQKAGAGFRGYKIIMVDSRNAAYIETYGSTVEVEPFKDRKFSTNHFFGINFGPKRYEDYPNTFDRFGYITEKGKDIQSLDMLCQVLNPKNAADANRIWRTGSGGGFFTISSTVVDMKSKCLYFSDGQNKAYERHSF